MANVTGINQFAGLPGPGNVEDAYGAAQRKAEFQRESPMSGAPLATSAIRAPQRSQDSAARGSTVTSGGSGKAAALPTPPPPTYQSQLVQALSELAQVPGIDPLLGQYLQAAQRA